MVSPTTSVANTTPVNINSVDPMKKEISTPENVLSSQNPQMASLENKESYFEAIKNFYFRTASRIEKLQPRRVAVHDSFWVFKKIGALCLNFGKAPVEDPLKATKEAMQQAIQESKVKELSEIFKKGTKRAVLEGTSSQWAFAFKLCVITRKSGHSKTFAYGWL